MAHPDSKQPQTSHIYDNRDRLVKVTTYDGGTVENVTQYYDAGCQEQKI